MPLTPVPAVVDFGKIQQGRLYVARFNLRNNSNGAINITRIVGSCSCTSHTLSDREVSAGESATLELTYSSGAARGNISTSATLDYFSEDFGAIGQVDCVVQADVAPNVDYAPSNLRFREDRSATATAALTPHVRDHFAIVEVACTDAALSATVEHREDLASQARIVVKFDKEKWSTKNRHAELTVKIDDPVDSLLRIPISVEQAGRDAEFDQ